MDSKMNERRDASGKTQIEARRDFLKKVGKASATVPAVALLLAASAKPASAQSLYTTGGGSGSS